MIYLKKFTGENTNLLLQGIAIASLTSLNKENKKHFLHEINSLKNNEHLGKFYFICNNKEIIGTVCIRKYSHTVLISCLCIFKEFQNKGYGTRILNNLKSKYKNYEIELGVEKENTRALHVYQKVGFKIFNEFNEGYRLLYSL